MCKTPGAIPHLVAGFVMFFVGLIYHRKYFKNEKSIEKLLLLIICLLFSCIPEVIGGLYHVFHILPFETIEPYHLFGHLIFTPLSIVVLLLLKFKIDVKRKPIWLMGFSCIILHIIMDLIIHEGGMWI